MPRVSKPLVLSEEDVSALNELKSSGNLEEALRAEIVLACSEKRTNKSIAQDLSVAEATVGKWKKAFREKGLRGLESEHAGGRPSVSPSPEDMEEQILRMLSENTEEKLTAAILAKRFGVDVQRVYYVLGKHGINLSRFRHWEYISRDEMGSWDPPLLCLYLSPACTVLVAASEAWPYENRPLEGVFVTQDRKLIETLERSVHPVSLQGILKTALTLPGEASGGRDRKGNPESVIEEAISPWKSDRETEFFIFSSGESFAYEGACAKRCQTYRYDSLDELTCAFLHWMGGRCSAGQHERAEALMEEIRRLRAGMSPSSQPFVWALRQQGQAGDEKAASSGRTGRKEERDPGVSPEGKSWSSLEELLTDLLPEMDAEDPATETGALLYQRGSDGKLTFRLVPAKKKLQAMEEFSFETKESFERDLSRLEEDTEAFLKELATAQYEMFLEGSKKKQNLTGVSLKAAVEMLRGRIPLILPAELCRFLNAGERFMTSAYRRKAALLCTYVSYRTAHQVFNELTGRKDRGCPVPFKTFVSDFIAEGEAVRCGKQRLAQEILLQAGFDLELKELKNAEVPPERMEMCPGKDPLSFLLEDDCVENPGLEPLCEIISPGQRKVNREAGQTFARELYAERDIKKIISCRSGRPLQGESEELSENFAFWLKGMGQEEITGILSPWVLEKHSRDSVYIGIREILPPENASGAKGKRSAEEEKKNRIYQVTVQDQAGDLSYALSTKGRMEGYQQLFAFLLVNDLMDRHFVFLTDGDDMVFQEIRELFGWKAYTHLCDFRFLEEEVICLLDEAIVHRKVKEENGGALSLSQLYAGKILSILWAGNVPGAVTYLKGIAQKRIRSQSALDALITFLTDKEKYMTCYALRKKAGLLTSSDAFAVFDAFSGKRQMNENGLGESGLLSASNIACLFLNGEDALWFSQGKLTFSLH